MKWGLTKHVSVCVAGPLLELDTAAGQILPKLHPPLRWQVLDGMLLAHMWVANPECEGVGWQGEGGSCGTRGLIPTYSSTMNVKRSQEGLGWQRGACLLMRGW